MMLAPDQRGLFLEALRPPEGYRFDCGLGTTFSLDLLTLLVAPLSLALLDVEDTEVALRDPVLLLEGVQRHADRLAIFCQAGRIGVPGQDSYLYRFLEDAVVEVEAPGDGVFHPKLWLLRYRPEDRAAPAFYRLLNLSRNLTFDRSWDLMLRLEGHLSEHRQYAYARNHPLGDLIQRLPDLALRPPAARIKHHIDLLQDEVRRVDFQPPEPFEDHLQFYPSGIQGYRSYRFDGRCDRALVISPFLSDAALRRVTNDGAGHVLISRADSIAALAADTTQAFDGLYVLHDMGPEAEASDPVDDVGTEVAGAQPEPLGLHAKLFVREAGWDASWLVGSANATNAAFAEHNVEFMVELRGRRSKIGIDKILGAEEEGLLSLLCTFVPSEAETEVDSAKEKAEKRANQARNWLVRLRMSLEVREAEDGLFDLLLHPGVDDSNLPPGEFAVRCWPVGLREEHSLPLDVPPASLCFSEISLLALTSFVAFEVVARAHDRAHTLRFVLNLPLVGLPEDRQDRILSAVLSDESQFLRYLRLLLAERGDSSAYWIDALGTEPTGAWKTWSKAEELALLESLVRALSRSPDKIDRIAEIVARLRRTSGGKDVLPAGFPSLWDALMQAQGRFE